MEDQVPRELHPEPDHTQENLAHGYEDGEGYPPEGQDEETPAERVIGVFTAPRRIFEGLLYSRNFSGTILLSLFVVFLLTAAGTLLMYSNETIFEGQKQTQIEPLREMRDKADDPAVRKQLDEQIEKAEGQTAGEALPWAMIGVVGFTVGVVPILVGLVVFGLSKVLETSKETYIRFVHAYSVAALGALISAFGFLLGVIFMMITGDPTFSFGLQQVVQSDSFFVGAILKGIDLFVIWWVIVIGIGIAALARNSVAKGIASFALTVVLVSGALVALFSAFMPG